MACRLVSTTAASRKRRCADLQNACMVVTYIVMAADGAAPTCRTRYIRAATTQLLAWGQASAGDEAPRAPALVEPNGLRGTGIRQVSAGAGFSCAVPPRPTKKKVPARCCKHGIARPSGRSGRHCSGRHRSGRPRSGRPRSGRHRSGRHRSGRHSTTASGTA